MKRITSQQFLNAFTEEWLHQLENNWEQISADWSARMRIGDYEVPWTQFMLDKNGFLDLVRKRLKKEVMSLDYAKEWMFLDAVFVAGVDLYLDNLKYPSSLPVIIEHEAGYRVEEEMWKLIFWRAPLKILITYDHDDHKKKRRPTQEWLDMKIPVLRKMIRTAAVDHHCPDASEYLFIIGCRKSKDGEIYWRWTSDKEGQELKTFIGT